MKTICVLVSSVDGKTTDGSSTRNHYIHSWTSKEDQEYFAGLIEKAECILMGRKTYEAAKSFMQHRPGRIRIVFTKNPQQYNSETIPDQLEFTSDSPSIALKKLEKREFTTAFLVGGSTLNIEFLKENLIDELWLTLEPIVLGSGNTLFATESISAKLKLLSRKQLNTKGTILFKYKFT